MRGLYKLLLVFTISVSILAACEPEPQPVQFGSDSCEYCRMIITESGFASQVVNEQGRSFKFDSIECMAAYVLTTDEQDNIHSHWVPDFANHDHWIPASGAVYLKSETLRSPMGLYLSAYTDSQQAEEYRREYGGTILEWNGVREVVRTEWLSDQKSNTLLQQE